MAFARIRSWFAGFGTAIWTGGFTALWMRLLEKSDQAPNPIGVFVLGALYGLAVLGLVRLVGAKTWGLPIAGVIAGPAPVALLAAASAPQSDRGAMLVIGALLGLFIGLLDWNRASRRAGEA